MASIGMQYAPQKLSDKDFRVILYLLTTPKAAKVIVALCDKQSSYLNEIQNTVQGSKTSTVEIIKKLESLGIIKSEWKLEQLKTTAKPRTRAVRKFILSSDKEKLIEHYERFFRNIEIRHS